nr:MAG: hypothetical protein DIU68_14355 [Chloroflexota bacterium]
MRRQGWKHYSKLTAARYTALFRRASGNDQAICPSEEVLLDFIGPRSIWRRRPMATTNCEGCSAEQT